MRRPASPFLSKSQFTRGLQCHKSLWLLKNRPELRQKPDAALQARFDAGTAVGELACRLFPGGEALEYKSGIANNISRTEKLIAAGQKTIYEATFRYDNVLAMVDILHRGLEGWELYEVKSSTSAKEIFVNDAAIQYYVAAGAGIKLSRVFLVYLNRDYTRCGELDLQELFVIDDVTGQVLAGQESVRQELAAMRRTLEGDEPAIDIGPYCSAPYDCDFMPYCWQHIPECSIFDIGNMRSTRKFSLYYAGVLHMGDIPPDFSLSDTMRIQVDAELTGQRYLNRRAIGEFLAPLKEPLGFLDFETFMEPVPSFDRERPYQQIPFQYSLHVLSGDSLSHHEFLGQPGVDPRPPLLEKLLAEVKRCDTVLVYNQAFEMGRLREMARNFPGFAAEIESLLERIVDLMVVFRNRDFYVREMCGSHSIKNVLPVLVPELSYEGLGVADGEMAMLAYARLATVKEGEEREKIRQDLLAYCRLDTLAMVRIREKLQALAEPGGQMSLF